MRTTRDPLSPWGERIWYDEADFDSIMDEVRGRATASFEAGRGVDVDAILEQVYGVTPDFGDVEAGCLGRTLFHPNGELEVLISRQLSNKAHVSIVDRRRLRSTLAHECAHIALHQHLHVTPAMGQLFPDAAPPRSPRVLCRMQTIEEPHRSGQTEWWEYQANRGMASLLLPKTLLTRQVGESLRLLGLKGMREALANGSTKEVLRDLMATFDVSMEMTVYRLQGLGFLPKSASQGELGW